MMHLQGKRVFIVEDNVGNRAIAQLVLEQNGAVVQMDRWGRDTIAKLQRFDPVDVILMDLMLPDGISGYDIHDQIRELPKFDHTPIVAVSAANPPEAIPETQAHGFSGFISKPISLPLFAQQIADIIAGEQIWYSNSKV